MKVALITPYLEYPGGVETVNARLHELLLKLNFEVDFYTLDNSSWKELPFIEKLKFMFLGSPVLTAYKFNSSKKNYDFVIANGEYSYGITHHKIINIFHGCYFGYVKALSSKLGFLNKLNLRRHALTQYLGAKKSNKVIAVSIFIADYLTQQGLKVDNVLGNGVDTKKFTPTPNKKINKYSLLAVGNNYFCKGFDILESLVTRSNFQYDITFLTNQKISNQFKSIQPVSNEETISIYNQFGILVFPSRYEGMQMVPIEAMSCGVPVIITEVGFGSSLQEIEKAFVLPLNEFNSVNLTKKIKHICESYDEYSTKARNIAIEHYDIDLFYSNWEKEFKKVIEQC